MALDSYKIKKSLNIAPQATPTLDSAGDVGVSSSDDQLKVYLGGAIRDVITADQAQTLTNKTIDASQLVDGSVTTTKISDAAITVAKLDPAVLGAISVSDGSITTAKLSDQAVTTAKLSDQAVGAAQLADSSVSSIKLQNDAVQTVHISDASVTAAKIDPAVLSSFTVSDGSITTAKLSDQAVTTQKLADTVVTTAKVSDLSITTPKLADIAVTTAKISDGSITLAKLDPNISLGGATATSFTLVNNQTSPANVTGFTVNSASNKHFVADISITRRSNTSDNGTEITSFYDNLGTAFNNETVAGAFQSDGKMVVGGTFTQLQSNTRNYLVRLNSNGTEDTAFYTNLGSGFNASVLAVAVQSNGKILVGGQFTSLDGNTRLKLVRLNTDGTEDTAFYTNLGGGFDGTVETIALQSDGKILVGGSFGLFDGNTRHGLVRLNTDGTEDTGFYTNFGGVGASKYVSNLTVQSNDKVIVNGSFNTINGSLTRNGITRINADGTDDSSFNTNVGTGAVSEYTEASALLSDGRIVVVGNFSSFNGNTRYDIVCLNSDGTEDTAFYTTLGTGFSAGGNLTTVAVNSADQILVGGSFADFDGNTRNRLIRLNDDGTEDTTFYTNFGGISTGNYPWVFINSSDQALILGDYSAIDGSTRNNVALVGPENIELMENFNLRGIYSPANSTWSVSPDTGFGNDSGVDFSMTSGGQLQYVSSNVAGTSVESVMKFIVTNL